MKYEERKRRLTVGTGGYYIAHCIGADYSLGDGISDEVFKKFHLTEILRILKKDGTSCPDCVLIGRVFNLVTSAPGQSPTYDSVKHAFQFMKQQCLSEGITKVAMPVIHAKTLDWVKVRHIIFDVFGDTDLEILVCTNK